MFIVCVLKKEKTCSFEFLTIDTNVDENLLFQNTNEKP